jgi:hypothetical protein
MKKMRQGCNLEATPCVLREIITGSSETELVRGVRESWKRSEPPQLDGKAAQVPDQQFTLTLASDPAGYPDLAWHLATRHRPNN